MAASTLNFSRRIRRTPYTDRVEALGVRGFSVVNHMILPKAFQPSVEEDYWHLRAHVQLWDVSCQRQVEIVGPDAARLVQWMTPRDLRAAEVGQCLYLPLIDEQAGMINDPVLLKLAEDRYWLSIADSDVLLWAKGLALAGGFNVRVFEPDVSPLAVQGPKSEDLMAALFGDGLRDLRFFRFTEVDFAGTRQIVARSGYSKQGGFEIYLENGSLGGALWDALWQAGQAFEVRPGCPNLIERIEAGLLSYGNEMTLANNPLECGMDGYCHLAGEIDYIGRPALERIAKEGPARRICGLVFDAPPDQTCKQPWPVKVNGQWVGQVTSGLYSPRLKAQVGLAMMEKDAWSPGQAVEVLLDDGLQYSGEVRTLPLA